MGHCVAFLQADGMVTSCLHTNSISIQIVMQHFDVELHGISRLQEQPTVSLRHSSPLHHRAALCRRHARGSCPHRQLRRGGHRTPPAAMASRRDPPATALRRSVRRLRLEGSRRQPGRSSACGHRRRVSVALDKVQRCDTVRGPLLFCSGPLVVSVFPRLYTGLRRQHSWNGCHTHHMMVIACIRSNAGVGQHAHHVAHDFAAESAHC